MFDLPAQVAPLRAETLKRNSIRLRSLSTRKALAPVLLTISVTT
jgi:hypothetical protein